MGLLGRLRVLLGRGEAAPKEEAREEVLQERILSTPGEREQRAVTDEGDRERHLDEGDLPSGPDR